MGDGTQSVDAVAGKALATAPAAPAPALPTAASNGAAAASNGATSPAAAPQPPPKTAAGACEGIMWRVQILVAVDFLAVAIVVPLLSSYFRELGISTEKYGLMASAYSLSQLMGGLALGALSDRVFSRKSILLLSFTGSAISYWLIGVAHSFPLLLLSRVVVGLVKQTMTVCTAIIAEYLHNSEEKGNRAAQIGRLSACATGAFVVGPMIGSQLYRYHKLLPPLVSASLFLLNCVLVLALLPSQHPCYDDDSVAAAAAAAAADGEKKEGKVSLRQRVALLTRNLQRTCHMRPCFVVVCGKLVNSFLAHSMDRSLVVGYYEERWQVESYVLGYIRSYSTLLMLLAQVYLVGRLARATTESRLAAGAALGIAAAALMEAAPIGLRTYLALALPVRLVSQGLLSTALQTLFTRRVPQHDIGAALGSMGVLQSASGVLAPLYGGALFQRLGIQGRASAAGVHYLALSAVWLAAESWAQCDEVEAQGSSAGAVAARQKVE